MDQVRRRGNRERLYGADKEKNLDPNPDVRHQHPGSVKANALGFVRHGGEAAASRLPKVLSVAAGLNVERRSARGAGSCGVEDVVRIPS